MQSVLYHYLHHYSYTAVQLYHFRSLHHNPLHVNGLAAHALGQHMCCKYGLSFTATAFFSTEEEAFCLAATSSKGLL